MNKYGMLFSIGTAMLRVLFHSTLNKYSSPDGITMIPSFPRQRFLLQATSVRFVLFDIL